MNNKINWFGRYLGCEVIVISKTRLTGRWNYFHTNSRMILTPEILAEIQHCGSRHFKLILKELEYVSDEDLNGLNELRSSEIEWTSLACKTIDIILYLRHDEIDFLRSKGYAIGIDKEYYITEEELKEDKK